MKINPNIQETLNSQYLQPGETVEDMLWRVANFVAGVEGRYGWDKQKISNLTVEYFNTMDRGYWLPSSPFLMNAGTKLPMLDACFVLGIEDDTPSIFDTLKKAAIVHKMGGGTGFDFSPLRAKGASIATTGGTSTGVLSFMRLFDLEGEVIKQGGRRRSANLAGLRVDHPEILDFIDAKLDKSSFNNFNFSVIIPNWFMHKVRANESYDLIDHKGEIVESLNAREVFLRIVKNNWECAEPGVLFRDNMNSRNRLLHLGEISVTNPCGEQPLLPWEACNLASINLEEAVRDGEIDWEWLEGLTRLITRFLDSAIDATRYPTTEIEEAVKKTRKIGIGIMGLHGMLIKLGLKYNSLEGRDKAQEVMAAIASSAEGASRELAKEKGSPPGWVGSKWEKEGIKIRNLALTSIAPTGTIGLILDTSSYGCEPIFKIVYARDTRGISYKWVNPLFEKIAREEGWYSEELVEEIIDNGGKVTGLKSVPKRWRDLFLTAEEIAPSDHIRMQAYLQDYVDGGISKTINMPEDSTIDDIYDAYMEAWALGCKGITIYRAGSREGVMRTIENTKITSKDPKSERPEFLIGVTSKIQSGCGKIWVTINPFKSRIREVFCTTGADGGCSSNIEEIARQISLNCWYDVPIEEVIDQLESPKCARAIANKNSEAKSCSDAIAKRLKAFLEIYNPEEWDRLLQELLARGNRPGRRGRELKQGDDFLDDIINIGCRSGNCG
jgi:ribonucleoside-diphosphate reductase alpha chain